jgi:lysophospholipase L1-like esterase
MARATNGFASRARNVRRFLKVSVKTLEVRSMLSAAAVIQWRMAPNFAPDPHHGNTPDLPNTPAYVNPPDGYKVLLDASHSSGVLPTSKFIWTVTSASGQTTTVKGEKPSVNLPEGNYAVQLEADGLKGSTQPQITDGTLTVKDVLIVSIGDSYASGEGNPVVPGFYAFKKPQWAYSPDPAMRLQNADAHRSTLAGPAQFALDLQKDNPQEAVTFVSVADSGATISQGLLGPMKSVVDPNYTLPAQLSELQQIIGSHPINVLTISIGANDIGFSTRVTQLTENTLLGTPSLATIQSQMNTALATLPSEYAALGQAIKGLDPAQVLITPYPDLTRNAQGQIAPINAGGINIISAADSAFGLKSIIDPLDQAVQTAATANGWTYVNGLSAAFQTHGYPSTASWIRFTGESLKIEDSPDGAFHPNAAGHKAIGQQLLAAYDQVLNEH